MVTPSQLLASKFKSKDITAQEHDEALIFSRHAAVLLISDDKPCRDSNIVHLVELGYTVQCRQIGNLYYVTGWDK